LDLEHDNCYGPNNRWNAGTDGHWKYVFRATLNQELLFNLDKDPEERFNLATRADMIPVLNLWRSRVAEQFEREKRGEVYVKNGTLQQRQNGFTYSPHYEKPLIPGIYWKPKSPEEQTFGYVPQNEDESKRTGIAKYSGTAAPSSSSQSSSSDFFSDKMAYFGVSTVVALLIIKRKAVMDMFSGPRRR